MRRSHLSPCEWMEDVQVLVNVPINEISWPFQIQIWLVGGRKRDFNAKWGTCKRGVIAMLEGTGQLVFKFKLEEYSPKIPC